MVIKLKILSAAFIAIENIQPTDYIISIAGGKEPRPEICTTHKNVLRVDFDDTRPDMWYSTEAQTVCDRFMKNKYGPLTQFSKDHANQIIDFMECVIQTHSRTGQDITCYIHCGAGVSRSPGVALALAIVFNTQPTATDIFYQHLAFNGFVTSVILTTYANRQAQREIQKHGLF